MVLKKTNFTISKHVPDPSDLWPKDGLHIELGKVMKIKTIFSQSNKLLENLNTNLHTRVYI